MDLETQQITDFSKSLSQLSDSVSNYWWMREILRARARKHGGMFPARALNLVRKFGNSRKPCFVGLAGEIKFLGDYRDFYSILMMVDPEFHSSFISFICERLRKRKSRCFFDVGANLGIIAASVAKRMPNVQVYAFEPVSSTCARTAATFALNDLDNVQLFQIAVSDSNGAVSMYHSDTSSDRASLHQAAIGTQVKTDPVQVVARSLDSLTEQLSIKDVGLIKFDVEGHEPSAIAGALELIARDQPEIIYEYSYEIASKMGWRAEDVADSIRSKFSQYQFFVLNCRDQLESFPPQEGSGMVNIFATTDMSV